jgi:hypothetical protein
LPERNAGSALLIKIFPFPASPPPSVKAASAGNYLMLNLFLPATMLPEPVAAPLPDAAVPQRKHQYTFNRQIRGIARPFIVSLPGLPTKKQAGIAARFFINFLTKN